MFLILQQYIPYRNILDLSRSMLSLNFCSSRILQEGSGEEGHTSPADEEGLRELGQGLWRCDADGHLSKCSA